MNISRRNLLKIITLSWGTLANVFAYKRVRAGYYKVYSPGSAFSGILPLSLVDMTMKPSDKLIFGDGHSHTVPLNSEAWKYLSEGKSLLVRSGVDSISKKHSHWIKVYFEQ